MEVWHLNDWHKSDFGSQFDDIMLVCEPGDVLLNKGG